jgi:hypothetical protein
LNIIYYLQFLEKLLKPNAFSNNSKNSNIGIEEKTAGLVVSAMITEYLFSPKLLACAQVNINMLHNQTQMAEAEYAF